jgi:hypothetical protein
MIPVFYDDIKARCGFVWQGGMLRGDQDKVKDIITN